MDFSDNIRDGAETALINYFYSSSPDFKPKLLLNDDESKIVEQLKFELDHCDEFIMSSAFITESGLKFFDMNFDELPENVSGKILTTDYLYFTEPKALKMLQRYPNIETRLYHSYDEDKGFHTKAYLFRKGDIWTGIVGSANITRDALTKNNEWNIKFKSLEEGELLRKLKKEFNRLWDDSDVLSDYVLREYEILYNSSEIKRTIDGEKKKYISGKKFITRNPMQDLFVKKLMKFYLDDDPRMDRALLISATGTGKTYAAAFAIEEFQKLTPKKTKVLFLVHRNLIAKQAKKTFRKVLGQDKKYGLFNMNQKDYDSDYLFANISSLTTFNDGKFHYQSFSEDEFDYIIVDEVHRAGSNSYKLIFDYFKPKFWLGMTASPERTDGFDIFKLFNHNIAHEIRLQEALDEELLCPFHYYGIHDIIVDGRYIEEESSFNMLTSDVRIDYLLEKSEYYTYSGNKRKALVFCRGKEEGEKLAQGFTKRGYNSIFLSGADSDKKRADAIRRLTDESLPKKDQLEFIFTIDIFNEGVDIPEINQVLLIRPTQSPVIFIQQLGRGLRKFKNKKFVIILDFIGQYKNNYMIINALNGTHHCHDCGTLINTIKGESSIQFDRISQEMIYNSINKAPFNHLRELKKEYDKLKLKLGRIPLLCDYIPNYSINPLIILNHKSIDCYPNFLKYYDEDYDVGLTDYEIFSLKFISKKLANGIRPHELIILKLLRDNKQFSVKDIEKYLFDNFNINDDFESIKGAINVLSLNFYRKSDDSDYQQNTGLDFWSFDDFDYSNIFFRFDEQKYNNLSQNREYQFKITDMFSSFLANPVYHEHFNDLLDFSLDNSENIFNNRYDERISVDNLKLYHKYDREEYCRMLNWPNYHSQIHGYIIKHNMCPIFVTYDKNKNISDSIKYKDEFVSTDIFSWMSRSKRNFSSKDIKQILNYKTIGIEFFLFIKKSDDDGKSYYYMGKVDPILEGKFAPQETTMSTEDGDLSVVNFKLKLQTPINEELYFNFIESNKFIKEMEKLSD